MEDPKLFKQSYRFRFPLVEGLICRVSWAHVVASEQRLIELMPAAERGRLGGLSPDARRRSLAAWALLRRELARQRTADPIGLPFVRTREGKPFLVTPGERTHFSLSHSNDHVMVAVSSVAAVGADVSETRSCPPTVLARFCAGERALMSALKEGRRSQAFTRMWTAKEACMKCRGHGAISTVEVGFRNSGRWRDIEWHRVEPGDDVIGAVAVQVG